MKREMMKKRMTTLIITFVAGGLLLVTEGISQAKITLTLWSGFSELTPVYELAIKDYESLHPNVSIKLATFDLRDQERKLAVALPSGTGPDMIETCLFTSYKYMEGGYFKKLPAELLKFRNESCFSYNVREVDDYGMPWFGNVDGLYWNKTMFMEAALPGPPKTYKEQTEYAQKLAKYDAKGRVTRSGYSLRLSGAGSGVAEKLWIIGVMPYGGKIVAQAPSGKYHNGYNNEAGRNALKLYIDYLYKYKIDSFEVKHDAEAFALERTAMLMREAWVVGHMKEHAPDVDYDTSILPVVSKYDLTSGLGQTYCLYVTETSKNSDIAWDFIKFVESPKYLKHMYLNVGWVPTRKDISYEDVYKEAPQLRNLTYKDYNNVQFYDPMVCTDEIYTKLAERLMAAYTRKDLLDNPEGIAKVIAEAAEETDNILKEAGLYGER